MTPNRNPATPPEGASGGPSPVVVGAFAFVCAAVGIAIFEDMHGWVKWTLEILWIVNMVVVSRLALAYRPSDSNRRKRTLPDRRLHG